MASVILDDSSSAFTYGGGAWTSYRQWYQTPTLIDGKHTVLLSHVLGTALDYAVVTVGEDTPLGTNRIIVDNEDLSITYKGSWSRSIAEFDAGSLPDGFPYHNSTQRSSTPGDIFTFQFSGTSATIYGIMDWNSTGTLSAAYTLDNVTTPQIYTISKSSPEYLNNDGQQSNFLFYSFDSIPAGNHTLVVNITACVNQTFIFDYLTYTPSFSSLGTMPNLTTQTSSASSTTSSPSTPLPIGGIVGGVLGGLALLFAIAAIILLMRRKRSRKQKNDGVPAHAIAPSAYRTDHFVPPAVESIGPSQSSPPTSETISPFLSASMSESQVGLGLPPVLKGQILAAGSPRDHRMEFSSNASYCTSAAQSITDDTSSRRHTPWPTVTDATNRGAIAMPVMEHRPRSILHGGSALNDKTFRRVITQNGY
ncbi:uncharacterized protein LACBIDRAFT_327392 [Laccaria bicolor S238N-H82]|uniref:Predicted protein n=1 Tax=Laccaria bicolor (strain S238N-H82 / ATCC MYA-4686) TaxID=486041 RepID=B0DAX5_LACBS|nr:uncharacterized protein LACBIDRAFT_327392 [Laccaria bicolor S238N-H82]EDR08283.1 predicted protein [Laccaria bicolor S238N-H82]|eukprot:XP_001881353.1 predicted protein [Laccaria bicolor S238N-H82]